jgi:hypothetical protein
MTDGPDAADFWQDGYRVAQALLTSEQCNFARQCMDVSQRAGRMQTADNNAYRGPNNEYAPVAGQALLGSLAPTVSALVGRSLLPAYSFWRIYERGAVLNRHRDRPACEVSVTIALAADPPDAPWPIGLTDLHGQDRAIALPAGHGLLYQGSNVPHWRAPLTGDRQYQLFLHYVVADGPFAGQAFDGGKALVP